MPRAEQVDLQAHGRIPFGTRGKQGAKMEDAVGSMSVEQCEDVREVGQVALHEGDPILHRGIAVFDAGYAALESGQPAHVGIAIEQDDFGMRVVLQQAHCEIGTDESGSRR
jgi:hypothetical protein